MPSSYLLVWAGTCDDCRRVEDVDAVLALQDTIEGLAVETVLVARDGFEVVFVELRNDVLLLLLRI
jgi:hypothetical protein